MRWRGVSHVEFAVLDYDESIAFYDALFGWLGYDSFSSLNMEYQSIYYFTRYVNPHSYIGIQPARTGGKLTHSDQAVGINHIALWARSRKEVDRFLREFLIKAWCLRHRRAEGVSAILARLLRGVLRRPDQRDSLGAGVGAESTYAPPGLVVLSSAAGIHPQSARSGENGAGRHPAGAEKSAARLIGLSYRSGIGHNRASDAAATPRSA